MLKGLWLLGACCCLICIEGCATLEPIKTTLLVDADQDIDRDPVPITMPDPVYPEFAREAQIRGTVVLHALVNEHGTVQRVLVLRGPTGLTASAVDAVYKWTFQPAARKGEPVTAWVTVSVDFQA